MNVFKPFKRLKGLKGLKSKILRPKGPKRIKLKEHWKKNSRHFAKWTGKVTVLWMIFCFSGNIYQVYEISKEYFKFSINTNVQLVVEDRLEMPAVTLCFHLVHLIKWHELTHDERKRILQTQENVFGIPLNTDILPGYAVDSEDEEMIKGLPELLRDVSNLPLNVRMTSNIHRFNVSRIFNISYNFFDVVTAALMYTEDKGELNTPYSRVRPNNIDQMLTMTTFLKDHLKCFHFEVKKEFRNVG